MDEKRYQEIRRGVMKRRVAEERLRKLAEAEIEKILAEPGKMTFDTADELMTYLDSQVTPESLPAKPRKKRR